MGAHIASVLMGLASRCDRDEGQTLAEYSLILAFIAVVSILALTALGLAIAGELDAIRAVLP
jgi:Flp pilus assembly pilin Flp